MLFPFPYPILSKNEVGTRKLTRKCP